MKSTDFITESIVQEIERIPKGQYTGGKGSMDLGQPVKQFFPLPGGSGLVYSITNLPDAIIKIYDPKNQTPVGTPKPKRTDYDMSYEYSEALFQWEKDQEKNRSRPSKKTMPTVIGQLQLSQERFPVEGGVAMRVDTITVDEDYRGMNIAKSLYGIAFSVLKKPLLAGDAQTPGGRRNWVSLYNIPGVQVYGYVSIDDDDLDEYTDTVMGKLGGDFMGESGGYQFFRFNVKPSTTGEELTNYVKNKSINVYGESWDAAQGGLYAIWTGR